MLLIRPLLLGYGVTQGSALLAQTLRPSVFVGGATFERSRGIRRPRRCMRWPRRNARVCAASRVAGRDGRAVTLNRERLGGPLRDVLEAMEAQARADEALRLALVRYAEARRARHAAIAATERSNAEVVAAARAVAMARNVSDRALDAFGRAMHSPAADMSEAGICSDRRSA